MGALKRVETRYIFNIGIPSYILIFYVLQNEYIFNKFLLHFLAELAIPQKML